MNTITARIGQRRAVHLIDAENLCGSPRLTTALVQSLRNDYLSVVPVGPMDQIILASAHISVLPLYEGWPGHRIVMRSGKNGADLRLAEVVCDENLQARFDHVYLGSGDGGLAPEAAQLADAGVQVTAVSRIGSMSARMRLAASDFIYLDRPDIAIARPSFRPIHFALKAA